MKKNLVFSLFLLLVLTSLAWGQGYVQPSLGACTGSYCGQSAGTGVLTAAGNAVNAPSGLVTYGGTFGGSAIPQAVACSANCSPTAAQLQSGIINNYGQSGGNSVITGPTPAAGLNFVMITGTAPGGSYLWEYTSTGANVYLDSNASAYTHLTWTAPAVGMGVACFSFQTGASAWALRCQTLGGTAPTGS
jgi:hypothetical protein